LNPFARRKTRSTFADYVTTKKPDATSALPMVASPIGSGADAAATVMPGAKDPASVTCAAALPSTADSVTAAGAGKHDLFELHSHIDIDIDIDIPGACLRPLLLCRPSTLVHTLFA